MAHFDSDPLESILRQCAAKAPQPWYPKVYSESTGIERDSLDPHLDKLRMAGFIRLTDWEKGTGQGYALTPEGAEILKSPRDLQRLKEGKAVARPAPAPKPTKRESAAQNSWERGELVRDTFLNQPNPVVTRLIFAANIMVFAYGMLLASRLGSDINYYIKGGPSLLGGGQARIISQDVIYQTVLNKSGGLNAANFGAGQWWLLLTCCFVHIGILHLGVNLWALYQLGPLLEQMWGHLRFLAIYLLSGLGGSCLALFINPSGLAGASGALCGLFASLILWVVLFRHAMPPQMLASWVRILGINFFLIVFVSFLPGVSWAGHLGGAVVGLVTGLLLHVHRFNKSILGWLALLGTLVLPALGVTAVTVKYYGGHAKTLREASQAAEGTLAIVNNQVLPLLLKPLSPVIPVDVSRPSYSRLSETMASKLPQDPEVADKAFQELQAVVENLNKSCALLTQQTDQLEQYQYLALFWDKERQATSNRVMDLMALFTMLDLYLITERDVRFVFERDSYAKEWIAKHSSRREPREAVERTIKILEQERDKLNDINSRFTQAGPFSNARIEDIRNTLERLVKDWGDLLERTQEYLKKEENSEEGLNQSVNNINKLRKRVVQLCVAKAEH